MMAVEVRGRNNRLSPRPLRAPLMLDLRSAGMFELSAIARKRTARVDQRRHVLGRRTAVAVGDLQMETDPPGHARRPLPHAGGVFLAAHHYTGLRHDAVLHRFHDSGADAVGHPEVIGRDDELLHRTGAGPASS